MQVILDSSFARPSSAPIWGGKKGEFRDWTRSGFKPLLGTQLLDTYEAAARILLSEFPCPPEPGFTGFQWKQKKKKHDYNNPTHCPTA